MVEFASGYRIQVQRRSFLQIQRRAIFKFVGDHKSRVDGQFLLIQNGTCLIQVQFFISAQSCIDTNLLFFHPGTWATSLAISLFTFSPNIPPTASRPAIIVWKVEGLRISFVILENLSRGRAFHHVHQTLCPRGKPTHCEHHPSNLWKICWCWNF